MTFQPIEVSYSQQSNFKIIFLLNFCSAFTVRAFNDLTAALRPALHFLSQAIDTVSAYVITPIVEECLDFWAAYGPIIVESIEEMSVAIARELREIGEEMAEKLAVSVVNKMVTCNN